MSRHRVIVCALAALLVSACASAPPLPAAASSADPANAVPPPTTPPAGEPCVAGRAAKRPPSGWTEVGTLIVTADGERPTSVEIRDASGKVIETKAAPKSPDEFRAMLATETCRLGGMLSALEGPPPRGPGKTTATIVALKPVVQDEKADVASVLCKEPAIDGLESLDESQKMRVAFDVYEERLTTVKWRAWLRDLSEANGRVEGDARIALRKRAADELAAAAATAGVTGGCWFEQGLRKSAK